nr:MAG TPA: hypothetical protein [Caudoviricetes sp.]
MSQNSYSSNSQEHGFWDLDSKNSRVGRQDSQTQHAP